MNRREFLVRVGGTLIAVPVILQAVSCGNDGNDPVSDADPGFPSTSDALVGHSHTVTIKCSQLTSASDVSYDSTTVQGHSHSFILTSTDLATINGGGQVPKNGSPASGHTHGWIISKPAGVC